MDRRLALEFLPGVAFLVGYELAGLLWAAAATVLATAVAVLLRWRWDGRVPWLAVATLVLALVLTASGVILRDETFVMVRPTVGAVAFACILAAGTVVRPSLLRRTLGYKLRIDDTGWRMLHAAWIALALLSGVANEVARRVLSTDHWALYNVLSDPTLFGLIYAATWATAWRYWSEDAPA